MPYRRNVIRDSGGKRSQSSRPTSVRDAQDGKPSVTWWFRGVRVGISHALRQLEVHEKKDFQEGRILEALEGVSWKWMGGEA